MPPITARVLPPDGAPGLEVTEFYDPPDTNDPQAMHLAVVIVDPETGAVTLRDMYAADDCGTIINPMIVEGQVHGGLAQGIGQALGEHIVYDRQSAQLMTASFLDYAMPRAADLPSFRTTFIASPAPSNPLGRQGRQRKWYHRRPCRHRQRRHRRALARRRARHRPADHAGNRLARVARGASPCQLSVRIARVGGP